MEEIGEVVSIDTDSVCVKLKSSEKCKTCGLCSLNSEKELIIRLNNSIGADIGNKVKIVIPEKTVVFGSFKIYIVPIIGFFCGFFLGEYIAERSNALLYKNQIEIFFSLLGLAISFIFIRISEKKNTDNKKNMIKISEIIK